MFPHVEYDVTSRHLSFDRDAWAELRAATPLTLRQPDLNRLRGINERICMCMRIRMCMCMCT